MGGRLVFDIKDCFFQFADGSRRSAVSVLALCRGGLPKFAVAGGPCVEGSIGRQRGPKICHLFCCLSLRLPESLSVCCRVQVQVMVVIAAFC